MSVQQKFLFASHNAFCLPSMLFAAVGAASNQAQEQYPNFHQGMKGFGRYYWHSYADQALDSYVVNFALASALHIDPRYHQLGSGSTWQRTRHAVGSVFVAHTDQGQPTLNTPQLLGSGVAASLSSVYYPERDRTAPLVLERWAGNVAGDGLLMVLHEFSPEFSHLGRRLRNSLSFGTRLHKQAGDVDPESANQP
jgi:hypothetical protein